MGSVKIHEIAKKLNISSKDVLQKAKDLGLEVKSHLSGVTVEEAEKIENAFEKRVEVKEPKKEKASGPVIIRREVIIADEDIKRQEEQKKKQEAKSQVGFINNRKKDFNIVYRNKQTKPLTVSELFGLKDNKKEEKTETKEEQAIKEEVNKNEDTMKEEELKTKPVEVS